MTRRGILTISSSPLRHAKCSSAAASRRPRGHAGRLDPRGPCAFAPLTERPFGPGSDDVGGHSRAAALQNPVPRSARADPPAGCDSLLMEYVYYTSASEARRGEARRGEARVPGAQGPVRLRFCKWNGSQCSKVLRGNRRGTAHLLAEGRFQCVQKLSAMNPNPCREMESRVLWTGCPTPVFASPNAGIAKGDEHQDRQTRDQPFESDRPCGRS